MDAAGELAQLRRARAASSSCASARISRAVGGSLSSFAADHAAARARPRRAAAARRRAGCARAAGARRRRPRRRARARRPASRSASAFASACATRSAKSHSRCSSPRGSGSSERRRRRQHAPQPAADGDRRGHAGAVADAPQRLGEGPARLRRSAPRAAGVPLRSDLRRPRCRRRGRASRRPGSAASPSSLQAPTTVAVPRRRAASRSRPGARAAARPPRSPARTRGSATRSPATSVATRRSAACSSASARCAALGARALGGHRGEDERGDRRGGDEQLRRQQAVGDRVAHERPVALRGVPDGDRADDEDRRGGAARAEAQRGPQEHREDDVAARRAAAAARPASRARASTHGRPRRARAGGCRRTRRSTQVSSAGATTRTPAASPSDPRADDAPRARSASITSPRRSASGPIAPLITRRQDRARDEREDVADAGEVAAPAGQAAQHQRGHHERHACSRPSGRARWRTASRSRRAADRRSRSPGHRRTPYEEQHGQAEPRGRPERRDRAVEIRELEADPPGDVVQGGDQHERPDVALHGPSLNRPGGSDQSANRTERGAAAAREGVWRETHLFHGFLATPSPDRRGLRRSSRLS